MKADTVVPKGATPTAVPTRSAGPDVPERLSIDDGSPPATTLPSPPKSADNERSSEQTTPATASAAAVTLSALGVELTSPAGVDGGGSPGAPSAVPSNVSVDDADVASTPSVMELQRQDRMFSAATAALEAPLPEPPSAGKDDEGTPAGSTSARSEEHSTADSGDALALRYAKEREAIFAAVAAAGKNGNGGEATDSAEGADDQQGWEGEMARRTRPPRRAAAAAASTRRQSEEEGASLSLRPPVGPRVVSRLPGVKYCHSRNAWIARWSEEGQERWKTFSVKACKGFTEARIQAVQFRWEKVRMKYAKLMKQATPQPGLTGCPATEGATDSLDMDAEAAELAAALQMYGNGSQVRIPRNKSSTASATRGRSRSPTNSARGGAAAGDVSSRHATRQKRQGGPSVGPPKMALEEAPQNAVAGGPSPKKLRQAPGAQQQHQQSRAAHDQLSASHWELLQQQLQQRASRGSSGTRTTPAGWAEEDQPGLARPGAPAPVQRPGCIASVKSDPGKAGGAEAAGLEAELKTQLFLQMAKRLQLNNEHQDATLMLQALRAIIQARQERQEQEFAAPAPQQQQATNCNSSDLENELLRLAASSAALLGASADRVSAVGNLSSPQQGAASHQMRASSVSPKDLSSHPPQPWNDSPADHCLADSVHTLTRLLADESRATSAAAVETAADTSAGVAGLGLAQWAASTLNGGSRATESRAGTVASWTQGGSATSSSMREVLDGGLTEEGVVDLQPWRRAVCVILEDVLENCILEVGSAQRQGSALSQERLQFAPMVGRLKALAARSCSKAELRPFLRLFARSIRLGLVPSKQSEDVQQLILDALGALDDALASTRSNQQQPTAAARGTLDNETPPPFTLLHAGTTFN